MGTLLSWVGGSVAAPLLRSAPRQQMGLFYEAAGLAPPLSLAPSLSLSCRGDMLV